MSLYFTHLLWSFTGNGPREKTYNTSKYESNSTSKEFP